MDEDAKNNTENQDTLTTKDGKYTCLECQNINEIGELNVGDVVECQFCGIEYEVVSKTDDGNYVLRILEEEK